MSTLPPPLDFGWTMKPLSSARTALRERAGGVLELTIDHDLVRGVSPSMLHWWFETVHRSMTFQGQVLPRYRVWHPRDHLALRKPRLARSGTAGEGATFHIQEVFGRDARYRVNSLEFVQKLDETGLRLLKFVAGVQVFSLEHWFTPVPGGTRYESQMLVGSSAPGVRAVVNPLLRGRVFPDEMGRAWLRHNVEEVGNFEFFLPALYAQEVEGGQR